ncbi:MAG: 6,7-dimethyl-8-ribityllumazine synthase [Candidatus Diapherotrites archaeon]|nr:6,7-dimethyl-8-ribityllumazine synthase [Candidatus Diapherotrites archaeon]
MKKLIARKGVRNSLELGGNLGSPAVRIGIVYSNYYPKISQDLLKGARESAQKLGIKIVYELEVNGSYDTVLPCKKLLELNEINGVAVLGAIVKGETDHDQVIGYSTAKQLQRLSVKYDKPVGFGIIGPGATMKQAEERALEYGKRTIEAIVQQLKEIDKIK